MSFQQTFNSPCLLRKSQGARVPSTCLFRLDTCCSRLSIYLTRKLIATSNSIIYFFYPYYLDPYGCLMENVSASKIAYEKSSQVFFVFVIILGQRKSGTFSKIYIYNAQVTTNNATKNYIGLTEGTFKQRFSQHKATFKHRKYTNSTELSKYIWKLRDNNQDFNIKWTIISRARPYNNISKRCDLCLTEKLMIITANPNRILNKRSELISKCRHENKFYLRNN